MSHEVDIIIEKIKKRKAEKGLTNKQLADLAGVSEGTLNKIFGTETKDPSVGNILKLIDALDLSEAYVLSRGAPPVQPLPLSEDEQELVDLYRTLNSDGRTAALAAVKGFASLDQYRKKCETVSEVS